MNKKVPIANRGTRASNPRNKDAVQLLEEMVFTGVRATYVRVTCVYCGGDALYPETSPRHGLRCVLARAQAFLEKNK